jgi:hypothetical protein
MRADLIWRAALPAAAVVALLRDAPQALTGGLALAGLALATERLVRLRATSLGDRVLVGVGGAMVVVVLTGMLMGSTDIGLGPTSWVVAVAVLSVAGLVVAAVVPGRDTTVTTASGAVPDGRAHRRTTLLLLPWLAAAVVVAVVSVNLSSTSLTAADEAPVEMTFGKINGRKVHVVLTSSAAVGPFSVIAKGKGRAKGQKFRSPLLVVAENGTTTTRLSLPRTGRFVISLNYPDQSQPLRTLILDR